MSGTFDNGHGNREMNLNNSFLRTVGSMVAASQAALINGVACSPTSGFHHATYRRAMGFCTFNGLMIAAIKLLHRGRLKTVAIVDCDFHYGNGTDDIITALSLNERVIHWTSGAHSLSPNAFLATLHDVVGRIDADLILYQAGVDMHRDDPLGGLLTTTQFRERDAIVFESANRRGVPIAWNLAGGYRDMHSLLEIHHNTMCACCKAWGLS